MIKTVLIDLDDTIFDFKACERQALSRTLEFFSVPYDDAVLKLYSVINDRMWKKLEKGEITRAFLRVYRFEVFLFEIGISGIASNVFADVYADELKKTGVLLPWARELLTWLSDRYDLYAVTNGYEDTQMGRIKTANIGEYFDEIFISQVVGHVKPSQEFFEYCRKQTGFKKGETVLIGDSLTSDIRGGMEYGVYTVWFNPNGAKTNGVEPNSEVRSLRDIPSLLLSLS